MNKINTILLLEQLRELHMSHMNHITTILHSGNVVHTDEEVCTRYAYELLIDSNGDHLHNILGTLFYDKLNTLHKLWHEEYYKISDILHKEETSFLSKFKKSHKVSAMDMDKCKLYFNELKLTNDKFIRTINASERRITALSDDAFH